MTPTGTFCGKIVVRIMGLMLISGIGLSLSFLVLRGGIRATRYPEVIARYLPVQAMVVSVRKRQTRGSVCWVASLFFHTREGRPVHSVLELDRRPQTMKKISVRYNPDNPSRTAATESRAHRIVPYLILELVILAVVGGMGIMIWVRTANRR